jgi:hypothetical protein
MTLLRRPDLDAAVVAGVITRAQADALEEFAAGRAGRPHASDERFVIVNNFAEFFVAAGLVILATAANVYLRSGGSGLAGALGAMAVFWALGEYFVFRRRMMAPGIVAALAVAWFAAAAAAASGIPGLAGPSDGAVQGVGIAALAVTLLRFRIPFLVLPLAAAIAWAVASRAGDAALLAAAACGLVFLVLAVRFDLRDPGRMKRSSQFAFWLYVAGSPLFVHPLFLTVLGQVSGGDADRNFVPFVAALLVSAAAVTLFGLLLDRRSPVISTLAYVAVAIGLTLGKAGVGTAVALSATLAAIGIYVILLGAAWRNVRAAFLRRLPLPGLVAKLPASA